MKTATAPLPPLRSVKVLDQLRERIRYLHYSLRTEQAYVHWVRAFIRFHGVRHPATLGSSEVEAFLSWLANERKVSVSTHRQALAALLFFYGKVLCTDLPWLQEIGRPRPSRRLPVVLTPDEVVRILGFLEGEHRLFAQLLYGTGMRISEGLQLRVKDLDFDHGTIIVREGKGSKDRALMLPESLAPSLREQLSRARAWWLKDQAEGRSGVALPDALERKYPRAGHSWPWFWVFAQHTHSTDPRSGVVRRHHMYDQTFQRAFKRAVEQAGITKPATPHTLRHSFATALLSFSEDDCTRQRGLKAVVQSSIERTVSGVRCTNDDLNAHYPEIKSSNPSVRAFNERASINAPIQGSAADIIRRAMIKMEPALSAASLSARMLLQVHDELIFEVEDSEVEKAIPIIVDVMENASMPALAMKVPLKVDARAATNWDEAH
ncbi:integrase/recombinase [Pseudomonas aeruginosa]|nr:integron integrase [Pseudomonas aeruginosa]EIU1421652.1 integron integrase [Pseudomonas aeruginosa]EKT8501497.1 integron integrase [Pseudomonas aeruginosa]EKT8501758.1 integron integrase [Pseudomonas aeruginosa]EKT9494071.1 integron integrase [Pseudomonas aeruginosa]